jgi:RimJ/RimL family protein N-acetyltransferase
MDIKPVVLQGRYVQLVPLTPEHVQALWVAGSDRNLWTHTTVKPASLQEMETYIASALRDMAAGSALPFATCDSQTGEVIGSTRFMSIEPKHKRVEIGSTFVTPARQRTPVNTEAKYLMFRHAFEVWGVNRVELKTGSLNGKSRTAMARLGAKEEGTLRRHIINDDGFVRDTVYFSVIAVEWPEVKRGLEEKLARPWKE